jgi:PST family polysaccharide transporter
MTIALLVYLAANPLALVFGDPDIASLFFALTPLPVLSALSATPIGLLRRELGFRPLAIRSIVGLASGGAVGIAMALSGHGVWALIAQALVQRAVELAVLWIAEPAAIGFGWSRACCNDMASFARSVLIGRAMYWFSGQAPRLVIGYVLGPVALGLFTLASRAADALTQIIVLPRSIVGRIELMRNRDDPDRFAVQLKSMARETALLAFPAAIGAAALMPRLFALWLDPRWQPGIVPTQLMLLTAIPLLGFFFCTAALMAAHRPDIEARISVWQSVSNIVVTTLAAWFGLTVASLAMLLRLFALLPLALDRLDRAIAIEPWIMVKGLLSILAAATVMGIVTFATAELAVLPGPGVAQLLMLVVEGVAIYLAALMLFDRDLGRLAIRRWLRPPL